MGPRPDIGPSPPIGPRSPSMSPRLARKAGSAPARRACKSFSPSNPGPPGPSIPKPSIRPSNPPPKSSNPSRGGEKSSSFSSSSFKSLILTASCFSRASLSSFNISALSIEIPRTSQIFCGSGIGTSAACSCAACCVRYISRTWSNCFALSMRFCMCARMSGTPGTLPISAVVPSGIKNSPEGSPMPVICFMKDSNEAFMLLSVSLAQSSHSKRCFCSKCASISRLLEPT
mmetsp:Transcript_64675/g.102870  ORF Transcript_64675/g.102870 Transcript_64675/m.102870 type:complete len:230 (-) Transcript_64675:30-719(-)